MPKNMGPRRRGGSSQRFSEVPRANVSRSTFNRSYTHKTTFDAGLLVPVFVDSALPGDTFNVRMNAFARLATPIKPIMDNMYLESFFFSVPYRLIWDNFKKFMGEQKNPGDSTDYVVPTIKAYTCAAGDIADYFGIPPGVDFDEADISALPFRAYGLIWNEWFRDQNLQNSLNIDTSDGPGAGVGTALLRRGKRHDYFTSALPWPQKGDSVTIPIADRATVNVDLASGQAIGVNSNDGFTNMDASQPFLQTSSQASIEANSLYADLANATATSINALRQAFQIQKLLERDARGGTRYTELVRSHFRVTSPDARQQRPEYLGGGRSYVNISPVAQTNSTDATTPQGNLSAVGTSVVSGHGFTHSFTEHSVVIGLVCVRADLTYQQGIERDWLRRTRYDFFWPALQHIGEQAIANREIYVDNTSEDDGVFGYQERYAEYRYKPSLITGKFRGNGSGDSLAIWHLGQWYDSRPALNGTFIQENPPVDRTIAVQTEPHFLFDSRFEFRAARPMPVYGVPGMIDHF